MQEEPAAPEQLEPISPEQEELLAAEESLPKRQYCVFRAGRERFCLGVLDVEEVVEWPSVTKMPLSPSFLMGIFNLRGSIVPIVDIAFTEGRRPDFLPRYVVVASLPGDEIHAEVRVCIVHHPSVDLAHAEQWLGGLGMSSWRHERESPVEPVDAPAALACSPPDAPPAPPVP